MRRYAMSRFAGNSQVSISPVEFESGGIISPANSLDFSRQAGASRLDQSPASRAIIFVDFETFRACPPQRIIRCR